MEVSNENYTEEQLNAAKMFVPMKLGAYCVTKKHSCFTFSHGDYSVTVASANEVIALVAGFIRGELGYYITCPLGVYPSGDSMSAALKPKKRREYLNKAERLRAILSDYSLTAVAFGSVLFNHGQTEEYFAICKLR